MNLHSKFQQNWSNGYRENAKNSKIRKLGHSDLVFEKLFEPLQMNLHAKFQQNRSNGYRENAKNSKNRKLGHSDLVF